MSQGSPAVAVVGVTVIDPGTRRVDDDHTVVTRGGEITDVVRSDGSALDDAEVVDGRGRYLISGLWDFHFHGAEDDLDLLLASGVTAVREMGPAFRLLATSRTPLRPPRRRRRARQRSSISPACSTAGPRKRPNSWASSHRSRGARPR